LGVSQRLYAPDLDRRVVQLASEFQDREDIETDPETGLKVRVISEVVYELGPLTEEAVGRTVSYHEVSTGIWIKETRVMLGSNGLPLDPASNAPFWSLTWETEEEFDFPSYQLPLTSDRFPLQFLPNQRRTVCKFKLPIRLGFRGLTRVRYTRTLHAAQPTRPGSILDLTGRDWVQDGSLVSWNVKNVLMDHPNTAFYDISTLPGDTFHGALTERIAGTQATAVTGSTYHLQILNAGQPFPHYWRVEANIVPREGKVFQMLLKEVYLK